MTINLQAQQTGHFTAAYFQGAPDANGNGTGAAANTPGVTTWSSSDNTILQVSTAGAFTALKAGTVTLSLSVPAAQDSVNSYSAFSATKTVTASLNIVTIQSVTVTVGP